MLSLDDARRILGDKAPADDRELAELLSRIHKLARWLKVTTTERKGQEIPA